MNVKISQSVPNIYQSTIGDFQKLAKSKNKLKSYFLAQKISRQQNLGNLEDIYKPLLTNQNKQLDETKLTNTKLDESKNELTNILQQLVVNGDLTNAAQEVIVKKLDKIDNGVLTKILKTVRKKPETIALIQMLNKYPNVIQALKDDNIDNLNAVELKIYSELGKLDDSTLSIIADFYSNISQDSDIFRIDSRDSS